MMDEKMTQVWREYQVGRDYLQTAGFMRDWPEYERFKNGDQWPAVTADTRDLPRPVLNIIDYLIRNKVANIISQSITMEFAPSDLTGENAQEIEKAAELFTRYGKQTWYEIGQDELNAGVLEDAATLGAGWWHYYWNADKIGGTNTSYIGALAGERVDSSCIFLCDPQNRNIQTQPYIIIPSRNDTKLVEEQLKAAGAKNVKNLPTDSYDSEKQIYDGDAEEQASQNKTTVLTKYFRQNGIVYMMKSVKDRIVVEPTPLNGNRRYPIEGFVWKERKQCAYGISEVRGLIPAQRAINTIYAMLIQCLIKMGFPTPVVYPGALGSKKITNKIGEILENRLGNKDAISYLQPPQFNNAAFGVVDNLIGYIRTMTGVTEVLTGDRIVSDMAASAIMAIQAQNKMPLKATQNSFFRSIVNCGRIQEEFFKNYVNTPRPMVISNAIGKRESQTFTGTDYQAMSFGLEVKVGPAAEFGEIMSQASLDKFYDKGDLSMDEYVELSPPNIAPWSEKLKQIRAKRAQQSDMLNNLAGDGLISPEAIGMLGQAGVIPVQLAEPAMQIAIQAQQPQQPMEGGAQSG